MTYAVVYNSLTGNTEMLAERIREALGEEDCVYFGGVPEAIPDADVVFAGFWTDKGICSEDIGEFIEKLEGKEIFLFGTAGFGGSKEYFNQILNRVSAFVPESGILKGSFMCQGRMQDRVRQRYAAMQEKAPQDEKIKAMLDNFDRALSHPDEEDLTALEGEVKKIWKV